MSMIKKFVYTTITTHTGGTNVTENNYFEWFIIKFRYINYSINLKNKYLFIIVNIKDIKFLLFQKKKKKKTILTYKSPFLYCSLFNEN